MDPDDLMYSGNCRYISLLLSFVWFYYRGKAIFLSSILTIFHSTSALKKLQHVGLLFPVKTLMWLTRIIWPAHWELWCWSRLQRSTNEWTRWLCSFSFFSGFICWRCVWYLRYLFILSIFSTLLKRHLWNQKPVSETTSSESLVLCGFL